jgi:multidrug transporter EmrE-like cation transporter
MSRPAVLHVDIHAILIGHMQIVAWIAFALAAIFEVGGDAVIRMGIKNHNVVVMVFGALSLAGYDLIVNTLDWDFSMIFGVYAAMFALAGVLFGRFVFRESIPFTTWLGLGFIMVGALIQVQRLSIAGNVKKRLCCSVDCP